jgi:hypothetical protein
MSGLTVGRENEKDFAHEFPTPVTLLSSALD